MGKNQESHARNWQSSLYNNIKDNIKKGMNSDFKADLQADLQAGFHRVLNRGGKPKLPPPKIVSTINKIRSGFSKIHKTMVPPPVALLEMVSGQWISQAIAVAAKLGVADHISNASDSKSKRGTSVEELADKTGADSEALYRLLRALTVVDIFTELSGRRFLLTTIGQCLRTDHPQSMRHVAMFQGTINWQNWGELEHCVRTGENAVEKIWGEKPFEHLSKNPEKAAVFDRAMTNISAMEIDSITAAYDFSGFKTIVDIGGGHGKLLSAILKTAPHARGLLFDLPHVIEGAKTNLMAEGLTARIETQSGNFFQTTPSGADAYIMKHILHDWSDTECLGILQSIRANIAKNGKLLIFEAVVPERNISHFSKFLDLEMLVVTTGRERTKTEYRELLERADFRLDRVVSTVSMTNIIEATPM